MIMSRSCTILHLQSAFENKPARDHCVVGEGPGEVPEEDPRLRIDLLRKQARMIRPGTERIVAIHRRIEPADFGEIVDKPERAEQEGSLIPPSPKISVFRSLLEFCA